MIHPLKSSLQIEPLSDQNHQIFVFRFKGEQHAGVKIEPTF